MISALPRLWSGGGGAPEAVGVESLEKPPNLYDFTKGCPLVSADPRGFQQVRPPIGDRRTLGELIGSAGLRLWAELSKRLYDDLYEIDPTGAHPLHCTFFCDIANFTNPWLSFGVGVAWEPLENWLARRLFHGWGEPWQDTVVDILADALGAFYCSGKDHRECICCCRKLDPLFKTLRALMGSPIWTPRDVLGMLQAELDALLDVFADVPEVVGELLAPIGDAVQGLAEELLPR